MGFAFLSFASYRTKIDKQVPFYLKTLYSFPDVIFHAHIKCVKSTINEFYNNSIKRSKSCKSLNSAGSNIGQGNY